ncbi:hypothetical protein BH23CHL5_BH23CHL5_05840 [soil metagenome]
MKRAMTRPRLICPVLSAVQYPAEGFGIWNDPSGAVRFPITSGEALWAGGRQLSKVDQGGSRIGNALHYDSRGYSDFALQSSSFPKLPTSVALGLAAIKSPCCCASKEN